jgi:hypothetical protein
VAGTKYRYVGTYATTLATGQPVEPGEFVELDKDGVEQNDALISDNLLIEAEQPKEGGSKKKEA